nr:EH signature domain-containing protein [Neptunomonas qingdaonensis]
MPPLCFQFRTLGLSGWQSLISDTRIIQDQVGHSDVFLRICEELKKLDLHASSIRLETLLKSRVAARAITFLWLEDDQFREKSLKAGVIDILINAQQPRLGRVPLLNLIQLYFQFFDQLEPENNSSKIGVLKAFERQLRTQFSKLPEPKTDEKIDFLHTLKKEGYWILALDGPKALVQRALNEHKELDEIFTFFCISGFDGGRYGDVCRAHYYLDVLRTLPVGSVHEVFSELLKPRVCRAPFEGSRRIGHAALEILIDRVAEDPGSAWQDFIINMAGDPRIASSAPNFRQWWLPLGESRIEKVRSWLSKEDLKLFLQAVEQYGVVTGKDDLQRMFPARKLFLEGLYKLKIIRSTRLMLGKTAAGIVKRILGDELKTSYVKLDGVLADKAIIYLDCGDFFLIEGSHSFRLWAYLAQPSDLLTSYDIKLLTYGELIHRIPQDYSNKYPGLPFIDVVHNSSWQRKVIDFLASNGIGLDIEELLSSKDYKYYISAFGYPTVSKKTDDILGLSMNYVDVKSSDKLKINGSFSEKIINNEAVFENKKITISEKMTDFEISYTAAKLLEYLKQNEIFDTTYSGLNLGFTQREVLSCINNELSGLVEKNADGYWVLKNKESSGTEINKSKIVNDFEFEEKILKCIYLNPGCQISKISKILETEEKIIKRYIHGSISKYLRQNYEFCWYLRRSGIKKYNLDNFRPPVESNKNDTLGSSYSSKVFHEDAVNENKKITISEKVADFKLSYPAAKILEYLKLNKRFDSKFSDFGLGINQRVVLSCINNELSELVEQNIDGYWVLKNKESSGAEINKPKIVNDFEIEEKILKCIYLNPGCRISTISEIIKVEEITIRSYVLGSISKYLRHDNAFCWSLRSSHTPGIGKYNFKEL